MSTGNLQVLLDQSSYSIKFCANVNEPFVFTGTDNMENMPPGLCGSQSLTCSTASPRKTGTVYILQGRRRQRVRLSVYYSHFEKYAVVSQDKVLCKDSGYINLRHCIVRETADNSFQILPRDCDGNILTFTVSSSQEAKDWVQALGRGQQGESPLRPALLPRKGLSCQSLRRSHNSLNKTEKKQPSLLPALEEEGGEE